MGKRIIESSGPKTSTKMVNKIKKKKKKGNKWYKKFLKKAMNNTTEKAEFSLPDAVLFKKIDKI